MYLYCDSSVLDLLLLCFPFFSSTIINTWVFLSFFFSFSFLNTLKDTSQCMVWSDPISFTSASICSLSTCPPWQLVFWDASGGKRSCREFEWHQDDRVDVCFRITDIKAGMMLVFDNHSHLLLLPVSFSSSFYLLCSMRYFDRAALFIEACLKYGVMEANTSSNILFENPLLLPEGHL